MTATKKTAVLPILIAWLVVAIPAVWGLYNTVQNATKLFLQPAAAQGASTAGTKDK